MTGYDPLLALWFAMGSPVPDLTHPARPGTCARCGSTDEGCYRVKHVVSDKFTGWDLYTDTRDPLWCPACAWGHSTRDLRTKGWRIGPHRTVEASGTLVADELAQPLSDHVSLVVPLSRHKHILPAARWGFITTDDRTLAWTDREVTRFQTLTWLRTLGFTLTDLTSHTPDYARMATLSPATMALVLRRWERLTPWRSDPTYLQVACKATPTGTTPDVAA